MTHGDGTSPEFMPIGIQPTAIARGAMMRVKDHMRFGLQSIVLLDRAHKRSGKVQFLSLELLRVIASFMIIIFHAHSISMKHANAQHVPYFTAPIAWYSCIELFFTMSGFLMIHMSSSLYGRAGGVKNFAMRRLTRTPPLYYIYTIMIAALFAWRPALSAEGPINIGQLAGSLLFYPMARQPIIAIGWTLNYEVLFYVIVGLSILLPFRWGWRFAVGALCGLVASGLILRPTSNPLTTWTDPTILDFAIGIAVAVAYYSGVSLTKLGRWIVAAGGVALLFSLHRLLNRDFLRLATMGGGMGMIVASATLSDKQWTLGRFYPAIHELGNQSYTMYLAHILVLKLWEIAYFHFVKGFWADVGFIPTGFVLVVVTSRFLYAVGEKPLTAYLRGVLKRLSGAATNLSAGSVMPTS